MIKAKLFIFLIILLAFTLRVFELEKFPAGLNADEASIGYNAYSIIKTGRDEYGQFLPLTFKSFGDYKPGLYFYFVIPFVVIFGLTEFAVRIPSAILGTGLVYLSFLLAREIFKDRRVSFFSALFMAINPWAIHFSRGAWETNGAAFFITLGVLLLIKGINSKINLFLSLISFLISMYLYQSPRLIVPVFLFLFALIYRLELVRLLRASFKQVVIPCIVLVVLIFPLLLQFVSGQGSARFSGLSFLSDAGPSSRVNELRGEHEYLNSISAKFLHNKITAYLPSFLGHYLDHFSGDFLFINGDPLIRNKVPDTGQFYLIQSLFLIAGILFLIGFNSKLKYIIILWIIISPLASAMTYQTPHAVRALNMVVPLSLVMGFGFVSLLRLFKVRKVKLLAGILLLVIIGFEFTHYLESYYVHSPRRYPLAWEYGFDEMVNKLNKYEGEFEKVIITDRYDQPYILVLFYKKYAPLKYQPQAVLSERDKFNFGTIRNFDKYQFRTAAPDEIKSSVSTLFVLTPEEAGHEVNIIDSVSFPNGENAFVFVKS